jgi:hypothetical protein
MSVASSSSASIVEIDLESSSVSSNYSSSNNSVSTAISRFTEKHQAANDDETASLAAVESKHLTKLRFFLITVLFWSTVGVGLAIWVRRMCMSITRIQAT